MKISLNHLSKNINKEALYKNIMQIIPFHFKMLRRKEQK